MFLPIFPFLLSSMFSVTFIAPFSPAISEMSIPTSQSTLLVRDVEKHILLRLKISASRIVAPILNRCVNVNFNSIPGTIHDDW